MEESFEQQETTQERSSVGAMLGTAIVVILVALGGIYFFLTQQERIQNLQQEQTNA